MSVHKVAPGIRAGDADPTGHQAPAGYLEDVFESLPSATAVVARDGRIALANRTWSTHSALLYDDDAGLRAGGDYLDFCDRLAECGGEAAAIPGALRAILSGGAEAFDLEYPRTGGDGSLRWSRIRFVPVTSANIGALAVHMDVTAEREARAKLVREKDHSSAAASISAAIAAAGVDIVDVATAIATQLLEHLGDLCLVSIIDAADGDMRVASVEGRNAAAVNAARDIAAVRRVRLDSTSLGAQAVRSRTTIVASSSGDLRDQVSVHYRDYVDQFPVEHVIAVPGVAGDAVLAVITVARHREQPFSDSDIALGEAVATHAAYAIQNAQLFQEKDAAEKARRAAEVKLTYANHELQRAAANALREADFSAALLRAIHEGYVFTVDGAIIDVNEQLCAMTGFTRAELVGQRRPYPFWPPDDADRLAAAAAAARADGGGEFDVTLLRKSGERFAAAVSVKVVPAIDGKVPGFITTVTDLAAYRRRELALTRLDTRDPLTGC